MFFLSKLCFLCLNSYKKNEHVLIEKSEEILIRKKLKYCLPEIVDSRLLFPKYICINCMNKLECFYKFKEICLQNNTHLESYIQTLTSTAGESYKYLSVKLTDIKYMNQLQAVSIDQTMSTVRSDVKLRTGEKENNEIYIKEEVVINETQCVEESRLLHETENNIGIKKEFVTSEHNGDIEFYHVYIKSIKCESIPSVSDVSVSRTENIVHGDFKYCNSNSKTNKLTKPAEQIAHKKVLKNHLKIHSAVRDYRCSICNKKFMDKSRLNTHKKIHTGIKNYECALCKKKFMRKSYLVTHVKIHTATKNYECLVCKKKFIQKCNLVTHEMIHTGTKNYECALCKKKFAYKSNLNMHEKFHTGIKDYECTLCTKKFTQKGDLVKHEKIHTGIKNYECSVCKRKFMEKSNLVKHEMIHTGTKNYECALCKKKFMHKSKLYMHEKIHIGTKKLEMFNM